MSHTDDPTQCTATTRTGDRCLESIAGLDDEPHCVTHHSAFAAQHAAARELGAQRTKDLAQGRAPALPPADLVTADLSTTAAVRQFLVAVTMNLAAGRISPRQADAFQKLAGSILRADDKGLAERLSKIEQALKAQAKQAPPPTHIKRRKRNG